MWPATGTFILLFCSRHNSSLKLITFLLMHRVLFRKFTMNDSDIDFLTSWRQGQTFPT